MCWMLHTHLQQLQIFTLFCLRCDVPADMVEIRNGLEIRVEKVVSDIEKLLEDEREQHGKIQSPGD
jgi:hypothetical protein